MTQNGAQLLVKTLENLGVKTVFGIPGAKIDAVFNALGRDGRLTTGVRVLLLQSNRLNCPTGADGVHDELGISASRGRPIR